MTRLPAIAAACLAASLFTARAVPEAEARDFSQFEFLLARSPFSLPTAEESSPLTERYALTGAVEWGGRQQVFVLDRTSQQRHVVTKESGTAQMVLLEFFPDPDPRRMRARVQIGAEAATLAFAEAPVEGTAQQPQDPAQLGMQGQPPSISPSGPPGPGTPRRVIRRRFISANPQPEAAGAGATAQQPAPAAAAP